MWTPTGSKENKYSFKRAYPQAFSKVQETFALTPEQESAAWEAARSLVNG